jgi:multidrug efflux pump subunit AcrA (membrane-fusion protein)
MVTTTDSLSPIQNDFLPPISRWTTYGGLFILCVLGLTVPIAAVAKYKVTVKAQGIVRPTGELRIVQAATDGAIMNISVKGNQVVKKGDVIATIDDSRLQTKKSQLQTNIQQAKLQLVQVNAQINAINSQLRAETERVNRVVASAQAELSGRRREYQDKQIISIAEVQEADANVKSAEEELRAAVAQLKSAQATLRSIQAALSAAKSKQNRYENVAKQGALSQDQLEEAQLTVKQQEGAVQAQQGLVETQQQTIRKLEQAVWAAKARRERTQAALNPSNAEVAIASERIAQEKAAGAANFATLDKERQSLIQQGMEIQKQLERDSRELQQVEVDFTQTVISAPADGIIFKLNLRNSSQTVRPGEEIAQIAPSNTPLVVKTLVEAQEVNKIKTGQKVHLRLAACPYPDYGTLKGQVKAISADAISPKPQGGSSGDTTTAANQKLGYEVTVEPENLSLNKGKQHCPLQLGMEARADIISREETVLQFFLRKARLIADV